MVTSPRPRLRVASIVGLLIGLRLLRDLWALAAEPLRYTNVEETYNATEAWLLGQGALWGLLPAVQYKDFCGGCTAVAVLAAPVMALGGDHLLAWKALALAWTAVTLTLGWLAVDRGLGRRAAWAALVALLLAPAGLQDLSLMLWGNHAELGLFLFLALALLPGHHRLALGLVLGLAFWFCRTALYFEVVLLPLALRSPGRRALMAGLGLGLAPLLLQTGAGDAGPYRFGLAEQFLPEGLPGALQRAAELVRPGDLGPRLAMARGANGAWALIAAASGAGILLWRRRWMWVALPTAFGVAFCLTGFHVPLVGDKVPVVNARYHAPWLLWLTLLPALGAAELRRPWGFVLMLGPVIAGWRVPGVPLAKLVRQPVAWPAGFAVAAARHLETPPAGDLATVACIRGLVAEARMLPLAEDDPHALLCAGLRRASGPWSMARVVETNAWLVEQADGGSPDLARGVALGMSRWVGSRPWTVEETRDHLRASDGTCPLCAAAGAVALRRCAPPPGTRKRLAADHPRGAALGACIAAQADGDPAMLWLAGAAWWRPWIEPSVVDLVASGAGAAFVEGTRSTLAGVEDAR